MPQQVIRVTITSVALRVSMPISMLLLMEVSMPMWSQAGILLALLTLPGASLPRRILMAISSQEDISRQISVLGGISMEPYPQD